MLFNFISTVFAEGNSAAIDYTKAPGGTIVNADGVFAAISSITNYIFSFFLVVAVLYILVGAYNLLISKGNPEGFEQAKKMILYAVIAVAIAVMSKSIVIIAAKIVNPNSTITLP